MKRSSFNVSIHKRDWDNAVDVAAGYQASLEFIAETGAYHFRGMVDVIDGREAMLQRDLKKACEGDIDFSFDFPQHPSQP